MAQLCRVARSTWQSWVNSGLFVVPPAGAFTLRDCLEVIIVASLRGHFPLAETTTLWEATRRSGEAERVLGLAEQLGPDDDFDLVIDAADCELAIVTDDVSLAQAVRRRDRARELHVVPLAGELRRVREAFGRAGRTSPLPASRPGRPRAAEGAVIELRARR